MLYFYSFLAACVILIPSVERDYHSDVNHYCYHFFTQRKLREVSTKFQLFQKPANFEQRMLDCKRVLDGVKAELHVLDVKGVDPDVIQTHLDKCMVRDWWLMGPLGFPAANMASSSITYMVCSIFICLRCANNRGE